MPLLFGFPDILPDQLVDDAAAGSGPWDDAYWTNVLHPVESVGMPIAGKADNLRLPENNEAHVWTAWIPASRASVSALAGLLSADEQVRAARFIRSEDRDSYVVAHGILRRLLGGYLAAPPAGLSFFTRDFGKPALVPVAGRPSLAFNLAHSGDAILVAVTAGCEVGVDVEQIRPDLDMTALAQTHFSAPEVAALKAMPPEERTAGFFRCWTRKEAYLKARGDGLGFPLDKFSVAFGRETEPEILWASDDPMARDRWSVHDLSVGPGYAGAVVCAGRAIRLVARPAPVFEVMRE